MIKIKKSKLQIEGDALTLGVEYAHITNSLLEAFVKSGIPREDALKMVDKAYKLGLKTKEEVIEEARCLFKKLNKEEDEDNE